MSTAQAQVRQLLADRENESAKHSRAQDAARRRLLELLAKGKAPTGAALSTALAKAGWTVEQFAAAGDTYLSRLESRKVLDEGPAIRQRLIDLDAERQAEMRRFARLQADHDERLRAWHAEESDLRLRVSSSHSQAERQLLESCPQWLLDREREIQRAMRDIADRLRFHREGLDRRQHDEATNARIRSAEKAAKPRGATRARQFFVDLIGFVNRNESEISKLEARMRELEKKRDAILAAKLEPWPSMTH